LPCEARRSVPRALADEARKRTLCATTRGYETARFGAMQERETVGRWPLRTDRAGDWGEGKAAWLGCCADSDSGHPQRRRPGRQR